MREKIRIGKKQLGNSRVQRLGVRETEMRKNKKTDKKTEKKKAALLLQSGNSGAANQSRTDDLILTKDVLYQLSHSSV